MVHYGDLPQHGNFLKSEGPVGVDNSQGKFQLLKYFPQFCEPIPMVSFCGNALPLPISTFPLHQGINWGWKHICIASPWPMQDANFHGFDQF
jgi:hypothetical protein